MLRRLHTEQPDSFAFTSENQTWAEAQMLKFPEGRQASAVIPLLWRAQEQEGWVSKPIIETVAKMLGLASIRVYEVATFYFMFQLKPVGEVAHFQICGTTSCMICGAEDLVAVCKEKIAKTPHTISADGKFSWEEVECLGACSNAPMAQIGKDYYEDLTVERFAEIIEEFARGEAPTPGPQNGRYASEPRGGLTSLLIPDDKPMAENASKELARVLADTNSRITDGRGMSEPTGGFDHIKTPTAQPKAAEAKAEKQPADKGPVSKAETKAAEAKPVKVSPASKTTAKTKPAPEPKPAPAAKSASAPAATPDEGVAEVEPAMLSAARDGGADDLKLIKGVGPKLEGVLNDLGVYHFDQIASWSAAEIAWVDARLKFKGRIERDDWIGQAKTIGAKGGAST
jgi:NADH-quinone oxidoreductase subunit E